MVFVEVTNRKEHRLIFPIHNFHTFRRFSIGSTLFFCFIWCYVQILQKKAREARILKCKPHRSIQSIKVSKFATSNSSNRLHWSSAVTFRGHFDSSIAVLLCVSSKSLPWDRRLIAEIQHGCRLRMPRTVSFCEPTWNSIQDQWTCLATKIDQSKRRDRRNRAARQKQNRVYRYSI